jgi:hypothetical protein
MRFFDPNHPKVKIAAENVGVPRFLVNGPLWEHPETIGFTGKASAGYISLFLFILLHVFS